jgi:hypothetical protein
VTSERSPIAIEAYTAVDHGRDPAALIATMDAVEALPGFQEAREVALRGLTLRPRQRVLDVGCGSGGALPAGHMESMLRGAGLSGMVTRPMFARVTLEVLKAMFADVLEQGSTDGQLDAARVRRWWAALAEQDALGNLFALLPVIVVAGSVP